MGTPFAGGVIVEYTCGKKSYGVVWKPTDWGLTNRGPPPFELVVLVFPGGSRPSDPPAEGLCPDSKMIPK